MNNPPLDDARAALSAYTVSQTARAVAGFFPGVEQCARVNEDFRMAAMVTTIEQ